VGLTWTAYEAHVELVKLNSLLAYAAYVEPGELLHSLKYIVSKNTTLIVRVQPCQSS
jgi:hypothetical protein